MLTYFKSQCYNYITKRFLYISKILQRSRKMKKKTYIKLMTATVLAYTLLLGACGNKKGNNSKQAVLLRQANHQVLKQLLLAKKARLRSPQVQLHLKRPRRLLINLQQLQRHHKRHQNKDKVKKVANQQVASQQTPAQAPFNSTSSSSPSLTNQAMILQLTANFKTNKQSKINATRVF